MKTKLSIIILLLSVSAQASTVSNVRPKTYLRIQIPFVQALETDGTESLAVTNVYSYPIYSLETTADTNGYLTAAEINTADDARTNIVSVTVPKLSAFRALKYCDFVLKAINHDSPGGKPLVYVYSSTELWSISETAPVDDSPLVYYQAIAETWPDNVLKLSYTLGDDGYSSIQDATGNAASNIEIWPSRAALAAAGINAKSRNISWTCLMLNGVDTYKDSNGDNMWFGVNAEWREGPPDY